MFITICFLFLLGSKLLIFSLFICRSALKRTANTTYNFSLQHLTKVGQWEKTKGEHCLYCHIKNNHLSICINSLQMSCKSAESRQLMKISKIPKGGEWRYLHTATNKQIQIFCFNFQPFEQLSFLQELKMYTLRLWMMYECNIWCNLAALNVFAYFTFFQAPYQSCNNSGCKKTKT